MMNIQPGIVRILDANINRVSEGLRVMEDIARFVLNNRPISKQLKDIRHLLITGTVKPGIPLLISRDVPGDWGAKSKELSGRADLVSIISANAKRAEEGLRVIEELAKTKELNTILQSGHYKKARFTIYDLERSLISIISRKESVKRIEGLYVVIDTGFTGKRDPAFVALLAIRGGANIIQLRSKHDEKKDIYGIAIKLKKVCSENNVLFIVNDHLDIAIATGADGVHLGQTDLPIKVARALLPIDKIIGCSASTVYQAKLAQKDGADYIAVGSIFPTTSKDNIDIVGLNRLKKIKESVQIPVVAIGGINQDNVAQVISGGADAVAVISAVISADDVEKAAYFFTSIITRKKKAIFK